MRHGEVTRTRVNEKLADLQPGIGYKLSVRSTAKTLKEAEEGRGREVKGGGAEQTGRGAGA